MTKYITGHSNLTSAIVDFVDVTGRPNRVSVCRPIIGVVLSAAAGAAQQCAVR